MAPERDAAWLVITGYSEDHGFWVGSLGKNTVVASNRVTLQLAENRRWHGVLVDSAAMDQEARDTAMTYIYALGRRDERTIFYIDQTLKEHPVVDALRQARLGFLFILTPRGWARQVTGDLAARRQRHEIKRIREDEAEILALIEPRTSAAEHERAKELIDDSQFLSAEKKRELTILCLERKCHDLALSTDDDDLLAAREVVREYAKLVGNRSAQEFVRDHDYLRLVGFLPNITEF